jgi:hypothetical protein
MTRGPALILEVRLVQRRVLPRFLSPPGPEIGVGGGIEQSKSVKENADARNAST